MAASRSVYWKCWILMVLSLFDRELEVETADSALQERWRYPMNMNMNMNETERIGR